MKRLKQWWNTTSENISKRDTKKSLLILTLQRKSVICTTDAQKQILEMKERRNETWTFL